MTMSLQLPRDGPQLDLNNMNDQEDTSGFYMYDAQLYYAKAFVASAEFELNREDKDKYTYPVYGWSWFNSNVEVREFFGLPLIIENIDNNMI